MKKVFLFLIVSSLSFLSDAKERNEKTFLIIFDKEELKMVKTSAAHIELNFLDNFETRSYTGNSESALMITVPFTHWTTCEMGETLVIVGDDKMVNLQEIAFRIIDLDASQQNFNSLISDLENHPYNKNKKNNPIRLTL
ncbi:MAG: hypothetical protein WD398_14765 [Cyclobacteriaceae bacterium]